MTDVSDCAQKSVEQEPTLRCTAAEASFKAIKTITPNVYINPLLSTLKTSVTTLGLCRSFDKQTPFFFF